MRALLSAKRAEKAQHTEPESDQTVRYRSAGEGRSYQTGYGQTSQPYGVAIPDLVFALSRYRLLQNGTAPQADIGHARRNPRIVDVFVKRIRSKIDANFPHQTYYITLQGIGYIFQHNSDIFYRQHDSRPLLSWPYTLTFTNTKRYSEILTVRQIVMRLQDRLSACLPSPERRSCALAMSVSFFASSSSETFCPLLPDRKF